MNISRTVAFGVALYLAIVQATLGDTTTTYRYDALGRLTKVSYACAKSATFTFDPAGNRATVTNGADANVAPVAVNDAISTPYKAAKTFDPRTNDTDVDCDALAITATSTPAHGTVVINAGTTLTYTPAAGYSNSDSFTYTISDGHSHTATATVNVTITGGNHNPVATNDAIATPTNMAKSFDPRANDYDPDSDALTITSVSTPSHGTTKINTGTSITYTPNTSYYGSDSFVYTVSDGYGGTATATVSVTVNFVNHAPIAVADSLLAPKNTAVTFDPRANDSDPDGDTLTITGTTTPSHGVVSAGSGGTSVSYTPTTGYSGTDAFSYTITDTHSGTASAQVSVTVNTPPTCTTLGETASGIGSIANPGQADVTFTVSPRHCNDANGDTLTVVSVTQGALGYVQFYGSSVTYTTNKAYKFQPLSSASSDTFTVTVSDGHGGTATATVPITIVIEPSGPNN